MIFVEAEDFVFFSGKCLNLSYQLMATQHLCFALIFRVNILAVNRLWCSGMGRMFRMILTAQCIITRMQPGT